MFWGQGCDRIRDVTLYDRWMAESSPMTPGFSSELVTELRSQAEGWASHLSPNLTPLPWGSTQTVQEGQDFGGHTCT